MCPAEPFSRPRSATVRGPRRDGWRSAIIVLVSPELLVLPSALPLAARLVRLIWFLLTVAESIVGLRVLFRALGSREAGFVRLVYGVSVPLVAPFRPIVPDQSLGRDARRVIEVSSLIAMLLLFLGAYMLVTLIDIVLG
jgi:hypothetical protein